MNTPHGWVTSAVHAPTCDARIMRRVCGRPAVIQITDKEGRKHWACGGCAPQARAALKRGWKPLWGLPEPEASEVAP